MRGTAKNLVRDDAGAVEVAVTTEAEVGAIPAAGAAPRHDIYFNRGVIGGQAYARRFQNEEPDRDRPTSPPMTWLSRGLFEAWWPLSGSPGASAWPSAAPSTSSGTCRWPRRSGPPSTPAWT
jgi:hypothetical protein